MAPIRIPTLDVAHMLNNAPTWYLEPIWPPYH